MNTFDSNYGTLLGGSPFAGAAANPYSTKLSYPPSAMMPSSSMARAYPASFTQVLQPVPQTSSSSYLAKQSLVKPIQFKSVNLASAQSANIKWAPADAVNFMDHLYFITNLVLDYLLENELPQELMNQTLLDNPGSVLMEHRNELIKHFHKLLIAACTCLCIGISIPLFGFMIACCWCTNGSKSSSSKQSSSRTRSTSGGRHTSRSRHNRDSESDWLALSARDAVHSNHHNHHHHSRSAGHSSAGPRYHRDLERRHRHGGNHRRSASSSGSSHGRSRSLPPSLKYESSCDPCLRGTFSSNLFIILLLISFFAVCAFVTNEYVSSGVKQFPVALNQSVHEIKTYLSDTEYEVDNLFRTNFNQLKGEINNRIDTSGVIIKQKLAVTSEAIALTNLSEIVAEFNDTKYRLERLDRELTQLKSRLLTTKKGLNDIRSKIERCPIDQCSMLRRNYMNLDNFRIMSQYEKLPDVTHLIKKVNQLIDSGIVGLVQKGKDDFDKYALIIQREVNGTAPEVKQALELIENKLSEFANEIRHSIRWSDQSFNQTRATTKQLNQFTEYERYRRYACLVGAAVVLFILLCYTVGWLFGSCRPQPTLRTYRVLSKTSSSASFPFSCGIFTVFLMFLPLILATIAFFLTGSIGDKVICRIIKHPEQKQSKQIYAMLQNLFLGTNLSISNPEVDKVSIETLNGKTLKAYRPNFADLITRCHHNQSIYKLLKLDQYDRVYLGDNVLGRRITVRSGNGFNLDSTLDLKRVGEIDTKLRNLIKSIELDTSRVTLLSDKAELTLSQSSGLSFEDIEMSFARLYENGVNVSPIDLDQLIRDIQTQKLSVNSEVEADLSLMSIIAVSIQDQMIPNITQSLLSLKDGMRHLKLRMFHGRNSFGIFINELVAKVRSAEMQLRSSGQMLLKKSANEFVDELNVLTDQYSGHVKNQVENVIGQCEPVSRALNSTTFTLCDEIVLPFNGYWLSMMASLILILPATLLVYALKILYTLAKRVPTHHPYNYHADPEDEISHDDDAEDVALAYHLGHHIHLSHKPSGSSAMPSAPVAADDGWSPTSQGYIPNTRPPPYAV